VQCLASWSDFRYVRKEPDSYQVPADSSQFQSPQHSLPIIDLQHLLTRDFSSSIIEQLLIDTGAANQAVIVHFYFTFNDPTKQKCEGVLRSLVFQLSNSHPGTAEVLSNLHKDCDNGKRQPTFSELTGLLKGTLECLPPTYIILDALDECTDRECLLPLLKDLRTWSGMNVHFLVTSREEEDIKIALKMLATASVNIRGCGVDLDIEKYIDERLRADDKLTKWQGEDRNEIRSTLAKGAQGM
jgi:hypothetical protein